LEPQAEVSFVKSLKIPVGATFSVPFDQSFYFFRYRLVDSFGQMAVDFATSLLDYIPDALSHLGRVFGGQ